MEGKPAGFWKRFLADFIDFLILTFPVSLVYLTVTGNKDPYALATGWTWQIIYTVYLTIVPLIWSGYIIGKRFLKIKVKSMDGKNLTFINMVLREVIGKFLLVYLTFGISTLVSAFMIAGRADKRGLHDFFGGTFVSEGD